MIGTGSIVLSAATRERAEQALAGEWGRALEELPVSFDDVAGWEQMSPNRQYVAGVQLIAEHAPIRILPRQPIVGAATLRASTLHALPVTVHGIYPFGSTSHLTPAFAQVLALGYGGIRARIEARLARGVDDKGREVLESMLACLAAADVRHRRHLKLLDSLIASATEEEREEYVAIRKVLQRVPEQPAESFREAVQSLWSAFCFQRLCGNWPGIGRIDEMLGPIFCERDLAAGRITLDDAHELLAAFCINGCDWIGAGHEGREGDGMYYQNIVLGGVDAGGRGWPTKLTDLVLEVVDELHIADFPIAVRISDAHAGPALRRIAGLHQRRPGRSSPSITKIWSFARCISLAIRNARRAASPMTAAGRCRFPGETNFSYDAFDLLQLLQRAMGLTGDGPLPIFPILKAFCRLRTPTRRSHLKNSTATPMIRLRRMTRRRR